LIKVQMPPPARKYPKNLKRGDDAWILFSAGAAVPAMELLRVVHIQNGSFVNPVYKPPC
jgi:hypothetical protein